MGAAMTLPNLKAINRARILYVQEGATYEEAAELVGMTSRTLRTYGSREGWVEQKEAYEKELSARLHALSADKETIRESKLARVRREKGNDWDGTHAERQLKIAEVTGELIESGKLSLKDLETAQRILAGVNQEVRPLFIDPAALDQSTPVITITINPVADTPEREALQSRLMAAAFPKTDTGDARN